MTQLRNAPSLCLLLLLTSTSWACDSETADTSAETDGGQLETSSTVAGTESETTDGDETSESTNGAETSGSTSGDETSGSTSTGEAQCEPPQDDALGSSGATITIENTTTEPRFVSPYSGIVCNYAQVEVLVEDEPVLWDHAGTFPNSCTTCSYGCSDGGAQGLIINPGQTVEIPWNGGYWGSAALSEACGREACEAEPNWVEEDGVPAECQVLRAMKDVEYTVRLNVFDTCPDSVEPDACSCDEDVCEVFFYEPSAGEYTVEAGATFPAGATVVLE